MQSSDEAAKETARRQGEILTRLRKNLKDHRLAIIIGAGVTLNVTANISGTPLSRITWTGLIRNGLDYLVNEGCVDKSNRRTKMAYEALEDPEVDGLLDSANILSRQLKQHGQFPTWLESVFGSLSQEIRYPALLDALMALHKRGATLLTTNYDDILEKHCGLQRIGRSNQDDISRFRRGDLDGVFHLHGSYHDAHEVVLDTTDYYNVKNSDIVQDLLRSFLQDKTILFVGCSSGLEDPNFEALLKWASKRHKNIPHRHCVLIRDSDKVNSRLLLPVRYGPRYEDLVMYLRRLLDNHTKAQPLLESVGLNSTKIPPKVLRVLPFGRNKDFVGRQSQLGRLTKILYSEHTKEDCQHVALVGLGGVGKTQIALECAFQLQTILPTLSVFWVRANNATSFDNAYRDIRKQLEIPGLEDTADVRRLVKTKLSQENAGRWLMIVDNADDFEIFYRQENEDSGSDTLSRYLPSSPLGAILFTTRDREAATKYAGSNVIDIDEMDNNESSELLQRSLQNQQLMNDKSSTKKLLEFLVNLPLAIIQAAAYLNSKSITIAEYVRIYEESSDNMIKLLGTGFDDRRRYQDMNDPIATTWFISFQQIQYRKPLAADYMAFIACIKEQDIPTDLLPPASEFDKIEALSTLKAFRFVKDHIGGALYDMHRLVHTAMQNWLKQRGEWERWNKEALRQIAKNFPWPKHDNRAVWMMYLPHAQCILTTFDPGLCKVKEMKETKETKELLWRLSQNVAESLHQQGKYDAAEAMDRQTLQLREMVLGKENPDTLTSMNNLAVSLHQQGKYDAAKAMHLQTLELRETVLGKEHPDTLTSMNNLAESFRQQGTYDVAEAMDRQTLQLREMVLGKENPDTLTSMNNLAVSLHDQGKCAEAEAMHRQTLQLRETMLGKEHPDTFTSMNNLAISLHEQGEYDAAEAMHRQTLQLRETMLGEEHPDTLTSMNNLAISLYDQCKWAQAEAMHRQTRQLREIVLGMEHPDTLMSMRNLAASLYKQRKYAEAETMYRLMLRLMQVMAMEMELGKEYPVTLASMTDAAGVFKQAGQVRRG